MCVYRNVGITIFYFFMGKPPDILNTISCLKAGSHLTKVRLLDKGYEQIRLIRSLKKFIFPYQDLVEIYSVSAETIINDAFSYSENV